MVSYAVKRGADDASGPPPPALSGAAAMAAAASAPAAPEDPYEGTEPFDMVKKRAAARGGGGGGGGGAGGKKAAAARGVYVPNLRGIEALALAVGGAAALAADAEEVHREEVHLRTGGAGAAAAEAEEKLAAAEARLAHLAALLAHGLAGVVGANAAQAELRALGPGTVAALDAAAAEVADGSGGLLSGMGGGGGGFCSQLRWLDLSRNALGVGGGVALGAALRGARRLECLVARSCELSGVLPASAAARSSRKAAGAAVPPGSAPPSAAGEYDGAASEALAAGAMHASEHAALHELDLRDNVVRFAAASRSAATRGAVSRTSFFCLRPSLALTSHSHPPFPPLAPSRCRRS